MGIVLILFYKINIMPEPINTKLYEKVKKMASRKFDTKTGIFRSSWIVKKYKELGGKYKGKKPEKTGLTRWFKEDWIDLNRPIRNSKGKITGYRKCGRQKKSGVYPLCRPNRKVTSKTPRTFREISKKSLSIAKKQKRKVKSTRNIQFGRGDAHDNNDNYPLIILSIVGTIGIALLSFIQG